MKLLSTTLIAALLTISSSHAQEEKSKDVLITHGLKSVSVMHEGTAVELERVQDKNNTIISFYHKTARGTIQPMRPFAPHQVETIGEREMIDYVKQLSDGDESIIIVDSRTEFWVKRTGLIPGAVNIAYTEFVDPANALEIMELEFDVAAGDIFDYSNAKTLVMYCNGVWCGQSPTAIRKLLALGYPAAKIKYYRGGMQSWASLGLTVIPQTGE